MHVRFSRHAIQRLRERFDGVAGLLMRIAEEGMFRGQAIAAARSRWLVHGRLKNRDVRIVFTEDAPGEFTILTVFWK